MGGCSAGSVVPHAPVCLGFEGALSMITCPQHRFLPPGNLRKQLLLRLPWRKTGWIETLARGTQGMKMAVDQGVIWKLLLDLAVKGSLFAQ